MSTQEHARKWKKRIEPFEEANWKTSTWQLINSSIPYLALWYLSAESMLDHWIWLTPLLALAASGFFMRIFIIFHDCGHYSFFKHPKTNEWVGLFTGFLTGFPYYKWRYEHALHHATSGNLNHRGIGDIWILTVNEYRQLSPKKKMIYRLYRNPLILFGLGPIYLFCKARMNRKGAERKERWNTYGTTIFILTSLLVLGSYWGWQVVLVVQGTIFYGSGIIGIWLFYIQHQFDGSYFEEQNKWNYFDAALQGSSFYKLPLILQWFTGNIGFHHVHHLGPRIPNYQLQKAHENVDAFRQVRHIGLRQSLDSLFYRLWDEEQKKFIHFSEIRDD
ncbi:fatty acid desaturase [Alicyclobacillus tolerans]|uniref:fatty acid desaturase n=1 Tax=Alicyclobacillus tolerans TaxID=90970 RepID=UPI003B7B3B55